MLEKSDSRRQEVSLQLKRETQREIFSCDLEIQLVERSAFNETDLSSFTPLIRGWNPERNLNISLESYQTWIFHWTRSDEKFLSLAGHRKVREFRKPNNIRCPNVGWGDASLRPLFMARYIKRNGPGCYVKRKVSNIGVTRRRYFLRAVSGIN